MGEETISQNDLLDVRRDGQAVISVPDPEVRPKAKHRWFSAEYKKRILVEAATCTQRDELGALLRRERLYSSLHTQRRRQRAQGATADFSEKGGPKPDPQAEEIARLRRENERLRERLAQAETIIGVQKSIAAPRRPARRDVPGRGDLIAQAKELSRPARIAAACQALGLPYTASIGPSARRCPSL